MEVAIQDLRRHSVSVSLHITDSKGSQLAPPATYDDDGVGGKQQIRLKIAQRPPPPHAEVSAIINDKSCNREQPSALWSSNKNLVIKNKTMSTMMNFNNNNSSKYMEDELSSSPSGVSLLGSKENPLVIGVSANCTFKQFVQVTNSHSKRFVGIAISVFEAVIAQLAHRPAYIFKPHYGTYAELIEKVYNKTYHAAVGDTAITADRYVQVDFSQPYVGSDLLMIVPVKPNFDFRFIAFHVFRAKVLIEFAALGIFTGATIWLTEYSAGNEDFPRLPFIGSVLWFAFTIISLSQKEDIRTNASRLVLTAWRCVVFVVGATFTAVLSSMLIAPKLQPTITGLDSILNNSALYVGCDANSFVCQYLTDVLHIDQNQIRPIATPDDYHAQLQAGKIKAAFLQSPHAKLFVDLYCNEYTNVGPSYRLAGLGLVFGKGLQMASDISEAILQMTQNGELNALERDLLTSWNCCSSGNGSGGAIVLGDQLFSGIFQVLAGLIGLVFIITSIRLLKRETSSTTTTTSSIHNVVQNMTIKNKIGVWAFLVLTECCSRFGVSFFRQRRTVRSGSGVEPDSVAIELVIE